MISIFTTLGALLGLITSVKGPVGPYSYMCKAPNYLCRGLYVRVKYP